jgi:hypothetical protein
LIIARNRFKIWVFEASLCLTQSCPMSAPRKRSITK